MHQGCAKCQPLQEAAHLAKTAFFQCRLVPRDAGHLPRGKAECFNPFGIAQSQNKAQPSTGIPPKTARRPRKWIPGRTIFEIGTVPGIEVSPPGLKRLGWAESELTRRRKGDRQKVALARRLRPETTMSWHGWRSACGWALGAMYPTCSGK